MAGKVTIKRIADLNLEKKALQIPIFPHGKGLHHHRDIHHPLRDIGIPYHSRQLTSDVIRAPKHGATGVHIIPEKLVANHNINNDHHNILRSHIAAHRVLLGHCLEMIVDGGNGSLPFL